MAKHHDILNININLEVSVVNIFEYKGRGTGNGVFNHIKKCDDVWTIP